MFTGLIEALCPVRRLQVRPAGAELDVELGGIAEAAAIGESIAVNGACLTVVRKTGTVITFDVSPETLDRTTLGKLRPGSPVNIERAMAAGSRFGGHIVQGHVDATGSLDSVRQQDRFALYTFHCQAEMLDEIVEKGSIAVDGISLTVASADKRGFSVAVIPVTLEHTNLGSLRTGDAVNIETDIIAKIIKKQLAAMLGEKGSLSIEKLRQMGF